MPFTLKWIKRLIYCSFFKVSRRIFMIYLDELRLHFEAKLMETSAEKTRKQEAVKDLENSSKELQSNVEALMEKRQLKKEISSAKINAKVQTIKKLHGEMVQAKAKCDEDIENIM